MVIVKSVVLVSESNDALVVIEVDNVLENSFVVEETLGS